MDGGGRVTEPLNNRLAGASAPAVARGRSRALSRRSRPAVFKRGPLARVERVVRRHWPSVFDEGLPRGCGAAAVVGFFLATIAFGVVQGGHGPALAATAKDMRDMAANAAGFKIAGIAIVGQRQLSRDEILATAGITGRTSLAFLNASEARAQLLSNAWIADATVQKLYPDRLQITIREREPYALWQHQGRVSVIAADGTVLQSFVPARLSRLPLVVGRGAQSQAKSFLDLLARYAHVNEQVRAAVLVGERRWNLRLKNGIDVRLPENAMDRALEALTNLDRNHNLTGRDIVAIDLRMTDRVTVRLSESAAQARDKDLKDKTGKKKGGSA